MEKAENLNFVSCPKELERSLLIINKMKECDSDLNSSIKWFENEEFSEWEKLFVCECLNKFIKIRSNAKILGDLFIKRYEDVAHRVKFNEIEPPKSEIIEAIREDNVDLLQQLTSGIDFDFNQTFSFNSIGESLSVIDVCAFYGAVKCFRFVYVNKGKAGSIGCMNAVRGGNIEIFKLCSEEATNMDLVLYAAIEYHRDNIFNWIVNNYNVNKSVSLCYCIEHLNIQCALFSISNGGNLNDEMYGYSALSQAVLICNPPLAEFLLAQGSTPCFSVDDSEKSELNVARSKGCKELIEIFSFQDE